jgi:hypothetical protein
MFPEYLVLPLETEKYYSFIVSFSKYLLSNINISDTTLDNRDRVGIEKNKVLALMELAFYWERHTCNKVMRLYRKKYRV